MKYSLGLVLPLSLLLCLSGCYPAGERRLGGKEELTDGKKVTVPTKVHLLDGSVILCRHGFTFRHDTVFASGTRFSLTRSDSIAGPWTVPIDSVSGLEYVDMSLKGARLVGSIMLGGIASGEVAIGSIMILKAIFGSCPTIYSSDSTGEHLEAECFSYSIGRRFENPDLDRLTTPSVTDGRLTLRLKNEALETHYINAFNLVYADHPRGTEAFPTDDGEILETGTLVPASRAVNSAGADVLKAISSRDLDVYTCDSAAVSRMFREKRRDWIECVIPNPHHAATLTIALRAKNSLQNTTLLYDVMMRNQGLNVLQWSEDINESLLYAWRLGRWYEEFSGIQILVDENGTFVEEGRFSDTGPIAWRQTAIQVPIDDRGDSVKIRFGFLPDNFLIDWIGFGFEGNRTLPMKRALCVDAKTNSTMAPEYIRGALLRDDDQYCVTYPGESIDLTFAFPSDPLGGESVRTYFVRSKGYYVEWVRPEWVRERPDVPGFDLSKRDEIAERLSRMWLSKKTRFEGEFFRDRIPSWGPGEHQ